jgi:hypothetical protein
MVVLFVTTALLSKLPWDARTKHIDHGESTRLAEGGDRGLTY